MYCDLWCIGEFFFFFKQKTAYEMRISDWSSDVCSSDLLDEGVRPLRMAARQQPGGRISLPAIILGLGQRLAPRGDEQRAVLDTRVLRAIGGVILLLVEIGRAHV